MSWRDRLGPASFRGVPFHVDTSDFSGGRRVVVHEFPARDMPVPEDLGRRAREFSIEAYVLGSEYHVARDRLLAALERPGPGELVHPYRGTIRAVVGSFRVHESRADGGMATFSIAFTEAPADAAQPTASATTPAAAVAAVLAARVAAAEEFTDRYVPGSYLAGPEAALRSATIAIERALRTVAMETQARARFHRRVQRLKASAASLVHQPSDLLAEVTALLADVTGPVLRAYAFDPGPRPPDTTPTRRAERACFDALHLLIQRSLLFRAADQLIARRFVSYDEAVTARDEVTDLIDAQEETAGDDVSLALLELRSALVRAVPGEESSLPRLVTVTPPVPLPSIVLAHQLYGSTAYEPEIVARNRIRHPGFLAGGKPVQVLSRG